MSSPAETIVLGVLSPVAESDSYWLLTVSKANLSGSITLPASENKSNSSAKSEKIEFFELQRVEATLLTPDANISRTERSIIADVVRMLGDGGFYFSPQYNLFDTLQRQHLPLANQPSGEELFCWNLELLKNLETLPPNLKNSLPQGYRTVRVMQGSIRIGVVSQTPDVTLMIISRRSCKRAGIRIHKRGANRRGEVANYAETEQLLWSLSTGRVSSFVQTRGSVPAKWHHVINLAYDPPIVVDSSPDVQAMIMRAHINFHTTLYGATTIVNLLKERGKESLLVQAYQNYLPPLEKDYNISYIHFDLNKHSGYNAHSKMHELVDSVEPKLNSHGFFVWDQAKGIVTEQVGAIRTNCKDSLDRTNIVQTAFGIRNLERQLAAIFPDSTEDKQLLDSLRAVARNLWADNGDMISRHYSGTGAMRQAQTRTGTWTFWGLWQDLRNSLTRYYLAYFEDGYRQNAVNATRGRVLSIQTARPRTYGFISAMMAWLFNWFRPPRGFVFNFFGFVWAVNWMASVYFVWTILRLHPDAIVVRPLPTAKKPHSN